MDLLSFFTHHFHGPKKIGGLYIRPRFELEPMTLDGGQKRGLRSGTTNPPALAGLTTVAAEYGVLERQAILDLTDTFTSRSAHELSEAQSNPESSQGYQIRATFHYSEYLAKN